MSTSLTPDQIALLKEECRLKQEEINASIRKSVRIDGDQITVNGVTRRLVDPPKNRKARREMIAKIKKSLS